MLPTARFLFKQSSNKVFKSSPVYPKFSFTTAEKSKEYIECEVKEFPTKHTYGDWEREGKLYTYEEYCTKKEQNRTITAFPSLWGCFVIGIAFSVGDSLYDAFFKEKKN